jgi:hypothetical protein
VICRAPSSPRSSRQAAAGAALALLALVGLLGATSCTKAPAPDDYFPLDKGRRWEYRQTTYLDDHPPAVETIRIVSRGAENMGGDPAVRRHVDSGIDYWLRSDKSGIYRIAIKTPLDRHAMADDPHRYVLMRPYAVGTKWEAPTTAYVLQRRSEVPKEIRRTHKPFAMVYSIQALDATVETPAGRFERCLLVAGRAAVRVYVDAQFNWRDIALTAKEWYCPGVGLVRIERDEQSPSRFMLGGRLVMELTGWN